MNNTIQLFGFQKGVIGKYSNHLNFPQDSLVDGSNFELSNGGLQSRGGFLYHSDQTHPTDKLPVGTVLTLQQVRFPTRGSSYLLCQVDTGTANKLYYCSDALQIDGDGDWTKLFDLEAGAGVISMAVLGDRVVMTEGINFPPLVWGGSIETDGSDWQTPLQVFLSWDDVNWHDATDKLTDPDSTTVESVGGLGNTISEEVVGAIYVNCDQLYTTGIYVDVDTVETETINLTVSRWDGSDWEAIAEITDGTSGLTQSGVITWTSTASYLTSVAEKQGHWLKIAPDGLISGPTAISEIRFQAPCQELSNISDGLPDIAQTVVWHDASIGSIHDISADVSDDTVGTYKYLNNGDPVSPEPFTDGDQLYIGYPIRFNAIEIEISGDFPNTESATLAGYYWDGSSWQSLTSFVDGTAESGAALNHKGLLTWEMPTDGAWKQCRPLSHQFAQGYYIKLELGGGAI